MRFPILSLTVAAMLLTAPAFAQTSDTATAPAAAPAAAGHFTTSDTSLGDLMDDPGAKAVLEAHIPDMVNNPQITQARPLTLKALQAYAPNLTDAVLASIDADLAKLPAK